MTFKEFFDICESQFPYIQYMTKYLDKYGAKSMSCRITSDGYLEFEMAFENNLFTSSHTPSLAEDEFGARHFDTSGEKYKTLDYCYGKFRELEQEKSEDDETVDDLPFT